jgi:hypothetical protein
MNREEMLSFNYGMAVKIRENLTSDKNWVGKRRSINGQF